MEKLELYCSYEEWKNKKSNAFKPMTIVTGKLLLLSMNFNRTKEEDKEYKKLLLESNQNKINYEFTSLTYEITDLFNKLKYCYNDDDRKEIYEMMGRKQCEIEQIKEKCKPKQND